MHDDGHYGDPPRRPRDETRALRVVGRFLIFAAIGFLSACVFLLIVGVR